MMNGLKERESITQEELDNVLSQYVLKAEAERFDIKRVSSIDFVKKKYVQVSNIQRTFKRGVYEISFFTNLSENELKGFCGIFGYDVIDIKLAEYASSDIAYATVRVNEEEVQ
jgi:hypothetical protein